MAVWDVVALVFLSLSACLQEGSMQLSSGDGKGTLYYYSSLYPIQSFEIVCRRRPWSLGIDPCLRTKLCLER